MDHTPPPFFKRGPAPLVRLFFFASLSLALLVIDARFRYVDGLRSWLALAAYPLQRAATWPIDLAMSVSGNSPNVVKAVEWANRNGLRTIALVGGKRGRLAELAHQAVVINDSHYGRAEDAHMGICHMICYAFMERPEPGRL